MTQAELEKAAGGVYTGKGIQAPLKVAGKPTPPPTPVRLVVGKGGW